MKKQFLLFSHPWAYAVYKLLNLLLNIFGFYVSKKKFKWANSQVAVGWPPIRAFRMNRLFNHSKDSTSNSLKKTNLIIGSNDQENKGKETRNSLFGKLKWMVILYVGRWISLPIILINLLKLHLISCFRSLLWALPFGLYLWVHYL